MFYAQSTTVGHIMVKQNVLETLSQLVFNAAKYSFSTHILFMRVKNRSLEQRTKEKRGMGEHVVERWNN